MADERDGAAIRAGGGVVWRTTDHRTEIALVHRPRYDDWSLPKGKLDRGEGALAAAVREVGEELGSRVVVGPRLGRVNYRVYRDGARLPKRVTYWSMLHVGGAFVAGDEVDDVAWLPVHAARGRLSYAHDAGVLDLFESVGRHDRAAVLVRHALAGKRREWRGDDALRPLDAIGVAQAERLGYHLARLAPAAVYSADRTRCVQTVEPLAGRLGLQVVVDPVFSDESYSADESRTAKALLSSTLAEQSVVICSQGQTIPGLLESLAPAPLDSSTRKAAFWVVALAGDRVVGADRYEDALHS